jgi:dethiobiotin synthetase
VAAGCELHNGRWVNEDVAALIAASNVSAPEGEVNPYRFAAPIAPHLAAAESGQRISLDRLREAYLALCRRADRIVVEGAGGLMVPLDQGRDFRDLATMLSLPVVLVVGMRLGCLNHALLTQEALAARGIRLAGWVANTLDPAMVGFDGNLQTLRERIGAPLLAILPHGPPAPAMAAGLLAAGIAHIWA